MPAVSPADARPPFVLVLDAGSSSLRAIICDSRARPVDGWDARSERPLDATDGGGVEADPPRTVSRFAALIDDVLARAGECADEITAVGMASLAATLVGVDAAGRPLTPIYAYSDTRPAAEVRELRATLDERAVQQRTGARLHTSYLPARLLWLKRTMPEVYGRVVRWLTLAEFVYAAFLGQTRASYSLASWSGLLNRRTLDWDREWLDRLGLRPDCFPPLGDEPLRGLVPPYAQRWPALAGVPWFPAYGDGAASNIGSGCGVDGPAALNIGTSGALRIVTERPPEQLPPGLWCYRVDRRRALVGGALNEAGGAIAWMRRMFRLEDFEKAEQQVARAAPDGHGLTVLPFLAGERSPGWNPDIRAAITGLGLASEPVDVLQAMMEGIACRYALIARELKQVAAVQGMIASGGGAVQSPVWVKMMADVIGCPVALSAEPEATSRGVAVLVLEALGRGAEIPPAAVADSFQPEPARHAVYVRAVARQRELYRLISGELR